MAEAAKADLMLSKWMNSTSDDSDSSDKMRPRSTPEAVPGGGADGANGGGGSEGLGASYKPRSTYAATRKRGAKMKTRAAVSEASTMVRRARCTRRKRKIRTLVQSVIRYGPAVIRPAVPPMKKSGSDAAERIAW